MQSGLNPRYMEERVVLFTYDGGHDPGTIRRAYVIRYSEGPNIDPYIDTYDFERREFRKFTTSKMTVISECEAKYIKDLPESLIGEFTQTLQSDGWDTFFHREIQILVAARPIQECNPWFMDIRSNPSSGVMLAFRHKTRQSGLIIKFSENNDDSVSITANGKSVNFPMMVSELCRLCDEVREEDSVSSQTTTV